MITTNGIYAVAWAALLLPLLGTVLSFIAETPRRAAQVCMFFTGLSVVTALFLIGYRFMHYTTSATHFESLITYAVFQPPEAAVFPSSIQPQIGVYVSNLSTSFAALTGFVSLLVMRAGAIFIRGDAGYRRFFWVVSGMTTGALGVIFAPSVFQVWFGLGLISAGALILGLQWWQRENLGPRMRTGFLTLLAADLLFLFGLVFNADKLGPYGMIQTTPTGQTVTDVFSYDILNIVWTDAGAGYVIGTGFRTLALLSLIYIVVAWVHSAQLPFTAWLARLENGAQPLIAWLGAVALVVGPVLVAQVYPLLLVTPHMLSVLAIFGAAGAVVLAALALFSRDVYRIATCFAAGQMSLAFVALGMGGYSEGLFAAFIGVLTSALMFTVAGSVGRVYRTRLVTEMGGAWARMRGTSLALLIWAVAAAGADLGTYHVIAAVMRNTAPNGMHRSNALQVAVLVLALGAALLTAIYAFRTFSLIARGVPVKRRGFEEQKIAEVDRPIVRTQWLMVMSAVAGTLIAIPGLGAFHLGKARVPGLTFSHWIFYGGIRQRLDFEPAAMVIAVVALAVGAFVGMRVLAQANQFSRLHQVWEGIGLLIGRGWSVVFRSGVAASMLVRNSDDELLAPLGAAPLQGITHGISLLPALRLSRLNLALGVALIAAVVLVAGGALAAGGHFWINTTK